MASTRSTNHSRRFAVLAILIVLAAAGYSAGWFYLGDRLLTRAQQTVERINQRGDRASCENMDVRGYPFRLGLFCDTIFFERAAAGVSVEAGALRSAAQIYRPTLVLSEIDGPARIHLPQFVPILLDWKTLRTSARLATPLPELFSLESGDLAAVLDESETAAPVLRAARAELHARPVGSDLDIATRVFELAVDPSLAPERAIPITDIETDIRITDGVSLVTSGDRSLRGYSGIIRSASLLAAGETGVTLQGPFAVGTDGLLDANLTLGVKRPQELVKLLAGAVPEARSQIQNALLALSLTGIGADGTMSLPLRISKGVVSLGFIPLGRVPPL